MSCEWCARRIPAAARADAKFCCDRCRLYAWRSKRRRPPGERVTLRRNIATPTERDRGRRLQLKQLEAVLESGNGTDWTQRRVAALREELSTT